MVEWFYCYRQAYVMVYGACCLFLLSFLFIVYFLYVCISFFFDAITYLVNKDAYKTYIRLIKSVTNNTPLNAYA